MMRRYGFLVMAAALLLESAEMKKDAGSADVNWQTGIR